MTTTETTTTPVRAGRREWIGLAVLALACLLYVMDLTVLHLAIPAMSADLQPTSSTQLLWIIDVYGFMVAGALVTMGTLGDRIGRRRLLLIGAAAFGAVSVLAAFSTTPEMLIVSRALLGIAGATDRTVHALADLPHVPATRSSARSPSASGSARSRPAARSGRCSAGCVLEAFWWGSVFLLALPVMGALLVLGPRVLPEYRDPDAGRLDLLSAAMSIVALLAVVYGLKHIAQDGLTAGPVLAIAAGAVVGAAVGAPPAAARPPDDRRRPVPDPRRSTPRSSVNFMAIFVMIGYFLFIAQYLQLVLGLSPLEAGLWSLPGALGFVVSSQFAPRWSAAHPAGVRGRRRAGRRRGRAVRAHRSAGRRAGSP